MSRPGAKTITNADIAELLAQEALTAKMPAQKALRRASRRALFWGEEAADIHQQGRSLTELTAVGPYIARLISGWIEESPEVPEAPDIRRGFLTLTEARAILISNPGWLPQNLSASTGNSPRRKTPGCVHSSLRTKEDQTARYIAALRNPAIQILGHPRGRVYNFRLGLTAEWEDVFDEAARLDKAVEIDGYPDRQDLNVDLLHIARKAGCRISLGTDSHGPDQLAFMEYSAAAALQAGIPRDRLLNFMGVDELLGWVQQVREGMSRKMFSPRRHGVAQERQAGSW